VLHESSKNSVNEGQDQISRDSYHSKPNSYQENNYSSYQGSLKSTTNSRVELSDQKKALYLKLRGDKSENSTTKKKHVEPFKENM
jgi:hypothetical protein